MKEAYILYMITITSVQGDKVYFHGVVTLQEVNEDLLITGLGVDTEETISHEIDQELAGTVPTNGATKWLIYIYKKVKEVLCPECS